jgi:hypothetical protein
MNSKLVLHIILVMVVAVTAFVPAALADESNQRTQLTFDKPVEVPGHILPAGTYWFVLVNDFSSRDVVRIFSADQKTLYATEMTASAERVESADETLLKFAERESSKPQALLTWFYPGELIGHEFLYSGHEEKELSQDKQLTVLAKPVSQTQVSSGF